MGCFFILTFISSTCISQVAASRDDPVASHTKVRSQTSQQNISSGNSSRIERRLQGSQHCQHDVPYIFQLYPGDSAPRRPQILLCDEDRSCEGPFPLGSGPITFHEVIETAPLFLAKRPVFLRFGVIHLPAWPFERAFMIRGGERTRLVDPQDRQIVFVEDGVELQIPSVGTLSSTTTVTLIERPNISTPTYTLEFVTSTQFLANVEGGMQIKAIFPNPRALDSSQNFTEITVLQEHEQLLKGMCRAVTFSLPGGRPSSFSLVATGEREEWGYARIFFIDESQVLYNVLNSTNGAYLGEDDNFWLGNFTNLILRLINNFTIPAGPSTTSTTATISTLTSTTMTTTTKTAETGTSSTTTMTRSTTTIS